MKDADNNKYVFYANEISVTAGPQDSALTFRWITPCYNEKREPDGVTIEKEVVISLTSSLLRANAETILNLLKTVEKKNDISSNEAPPES